MSPAFTRNRPQSSAPTALDSGGTILNAYAITNPDALQWAVARYHVERLEGELTDMDRGWVKERLWNLRREHLSSAPGQGFVLSEHRDTVLVPGHWQLPDQAEFEGLRIRRGAAFVLQATDVAHRTAVAELLTAALRRHLRGGSTALGQVWVHGRGLCELPRPSADDPDVLYARRFEVLPATVRGHRWVVQVHLGTVSVDARTVADYAAAGDLAELRKRLVLKRMNRETRALEPVAVHVFVQQGGKAPERMTLVAPEELLALADLPLDTQRGATARLLRCQRLTAAREEVEVLPADVRLILDTQITQDAHRETILSVEARAELIGRVRGAVEGVDVFGVPLGLARTLYAVPDAQIRTIALPPLHVHSGRPDGGTDTVPGASGEEAIRERARARSRAVRERGHLHARPLVPLLAVPRGYAQARALRLKADLDALARHLNPPFEFTLTSYRSPEEVQRACETGGHNALIAVLPEGSAAPQQDGDTHDQIKRHVRVPSQCIQEDHTLPARLVALPASEVPQHVARALQGRLRLVLENLVVKAGWIPYTTARPSAFNVHVGIDVGGLRNNYAMACVGYGLATPGAQPVYLPLPIPVDSPQVEPIPDGALCEGLDRGLQRLVTALGDADFSSVLFLRDGDMNGHGPVWQEIDGLRDLKARWVASGRVPADARWVVAELSKRAEHWRQFRAGEGGLHNPVVGTATVPFDAPHQALLATTGAPYLTHGTADPLFVTVSALDCEVDIWDVLQDVLWGADLSFTNAAQGTSLPWVLHVADRAALAVAEGHQLGTGLLV